MTLRIALCAFAALRETIARQGAVTLSGRREKSGKSCVKQYCLRNPWMVFFFWDIETKILSVLRALGG